MQSAAAHHQSAGTTTRRAGLATRLRAGLAEPNAAEPTVVEFAAVITEAKAALGLNEQQMAELLRVSRPTISRWAAAEARPQRLARKAVYEVLARTADEQSHPAPAGENGPQAGAFR